MTDKTAKTNIINGIFYSIFQENDKVIAKVGKYNTKIFITWDAAEQWIKKTAIDNYYETKRNKKG